MMRGASGAGGRSNSGWGVGPCFPVGEEGFGEGLGGIDGDIAGDDEDGVGGAVGGVVEGFDIVEGDGGEGCGSGVAADGRVAVEGGDEFAVGDGGGVA